MKLPSLNFTQWLQLGLLIALLINAVVHYTSPAYRYYQDKFSQFETSFSDFRRRVQCDFVPSIYEIISNRSVVVSSCPSPSSSLVGNYSVKSNEVGRLFDLDYHYFESGSSSCFEVDGHYYTVGDSFYGSVIRHVSPTIVVTDQCQFLKPLLVKAQFNSRAPSRSSSSAASSNSVPLSVYHVPQLPDVYGSHGEHVTY